MASSFVGRATELSSLTELVRRSHQEHRPAVALITGDPGSGKSRLLAEVVERSRIGRTFQAVGFEPAQRVPLAAVGSLLRDLARAPVHGADLASLAFGDAAAAHAREAAALEPLRIFEATHRALSTAGPSLLAIDDLQWVDEVSVALVHYIARASEASRTPLAVLASGRPSPVGAALGSAMASIIDGSRVRSLTLEPLTVEEGVVLAHELDANIARARAIELWQRAAGSPFWLQALVASRGRAHPSDLIGERLRALGSDASALVAALAVGARPFLPEEIADVQGWPPERTLGAVAELVNAGLASETGGSVRLAHDLIREAATDDLPERTRLGLHARYADWIERHAGDDVQLLREALEHRHAAGLPSSELALRLVRSGRRRLLGNDALGLIASVADQLPPGSTEALALDAGLANLALEVGDHDLALDRWRRVADHELDEVARQAAQLAAAEAAFLSNQHDEAIRLVAMAREIRGDSATTIRLDALEAEVMLWLGHETATGRDLADRALMAARSLAATATRIDELSIPVRRAYLAALGAAHGAALQQDRAADMLVVAEETLPVARTLDEEAYLEAVVRIGSALERQGRLTDAVASFRRAWDESRRLVLPRSSIEAGHSLARVLAELGELGEAREIAGELVELDARIGHRLKGYGSAARIVHMIDLALGDPRTALAKLRRVAEIEADPHYRIGTRQVVARWEARTAGIRAADSVERELDAARADAELARCPRCAAELRIVSAELLARIGRVEDAAELRRAWEADTPPREPIHEIWRKRAAAAIAAARGDVEEARTTLEALVDEAQAAGRTEAVLWARLDLGRLLAATDPTAAATALRSAVALANKTGAVTHRRLAEQVLRGLGVRTWRRGRRDAGAGVASLSAREREVAALVARGASNREIAETLFVTPKTVERHITNALAKLGARNRTELATRMNAGFPR